MFRVSVAAPTFRYDDVLETDVETPAREITSRHGVDRRSLLPLADRRNAIECCAVFSDERKAVTGAALFPAAMETIDNGYWKISSRAAICGYGSLSIGGEFENGLSELNAVLRDAVK
jgi:hypothetical protein